MRNKKLIVIAMSVVFISNTIPVFAQDLPKLSTPKLQPLQMPTLSTSFKDLKNNINNKGNLPDLPEMQKLPEMDMSGFKDMKDQYDKGVGDLSKEGYGKKVELKNPSPLVNNKESLFDDMNNKYEQAKTNLPKTNLPEDQIRSKLSNFDSAVSGKLASTTSANESEVNGKKSSAQASLKEGEAQFQKALEGKLSLGNFEAPQTEFPSWLYKPSKNITDRQAEVRGKKAQIANDGGEVAGLQRSLQAYSVNAPSTASIDSIYKTNLDKVNGNKSHHGIIADSIYKISGATSGMKSSLGDDYSQARQYFNKKMN